MLKVAYESEEALQLDADVMETIYHAALEASVELAMEQGSYEGFAGSPFSQGRLQMDMWDRVPKLSGRYDWDRMRADVVAHGTRNSLLTALMPTASTSQLLGNNECFEPFHSNMFKRTTLAGEFLVVNKHLMRDLIHLGKWDEDMRARIMASDGSVQGMSDLPADLRKVYKTVWEVPMKCVIDHAQRRGPYVDQSQSMNLFYDRPSFVKLRASTTMAHGCRNGIKTGMYYLRSKPATAAVKQGASSQRGVLPDTSLPRACVCARGRVRGIAPGAKGHFAPFPPPVIDTDMSDFTFDTTEILVRFFKYIFEGVIVAVAAYLIPGKKMNAEEVLIIGLIAAATFAVLDLFAPSIGASVRTGAGVGIGLNLVNTNVMGAGGPMMLR
ncbi:MAG: hypothetical protein WDW38_006544 [Sanguina aurantia]